MINTMLNAYNILNINNLFNYDNENINKDKMTNDQKNIISHILNSVNSNKQSLVMMHGGSGVGKSTVISYLIQELKLISPLKLTKLNDLIHLLMVTPNGCD